VIFDTLKPKIENILDSSQRSVFEKMTQVCETLQGSLPTYNWVGFYLANEAERALHLKAFAGEPTAHTVIPFGKGICGQVAENDANFVVSDVKAQDNYISCSINVKAEIVIPLFKNGINIGQIDVDSHTPNAFTNKDERFLEWVNSKVASLL